LYIDKVLKFTEGAKSKVTEYFPGESISRYT